MPKEINLGFRIDQRQARREIPRAMAQIDPRRLKRLSPFLQKRLRALMGFARGSQERRIVYLRFVERKSSAEAGAEMDLTLIQAKQIWRSVICRERMEKQRLDRLQAIKKSCKTKRKFITETDHG